MKKLSILRSMILLMVLLIAVSLGFWSFVVLEKTLLADGMLIVASDGAEMRVTGGTLYVLAGSADRAAFSPLFPFIAGVLYLVLVIFALLGATSLFRTFKPESSIER